MSLVLSKCKYKREERFISKYQIEGVGVPAV